MNLITLKVLVTGDFHQLPPVAIGKSLRYAFEARCWSQLIGDRTYLLRRIFRQVGDIRLQKILREVRSGIVSKESVALLKSNVGNETSLTPSLYSLVKDVAASNDDSLDRLDGILWTSNSNDSKNSEMLDKFLLSPRILRLKVGALVMFLKNRGSLVNGSMGKVVGFEEGNPVVKFANSMLTVEKEIFEVVSNEDETLMVSYHSE
jgi:ATP-dependent DNA helicase PIF1